MTTIRGHKKRRATFRHHGPKPSFKMSRRTQQERHHRMIDTMMDNVRRAIAERLTEEVNEDD